MQCSIVREWPINVQPFDAKMMMTVIRRTDCLPSPRVSESAAMHKCIYNDPVHRFAFNCWVMKPECLQDKIDTGKGAIHTSNNQIFGVHESERKVCSVRIFRAELFYGHFQHSNTSQKM